MKKRMKLMLAVLLACTCVACANERKEDIVEVQYVGVTFDTFFDDETYWNGYMDYAQKVYDSILDGTETTILDFDSEAEAVWFNQYFFYIYGVTGSLLLPINENGQRVYKLFYTQDEFIVFNKHVYKNDAFSNYDAAYQNIEILDEINRIIKELVPNKIPQDEAVELIWKYIVDNYDYDPDISDLSDFVQKKRGNCSAYAAMFRQMCRAVGIQNNICIGHNERGLHAWNQVLIDDTWYFYDLTSYVSVSRNINKSDFIKADQLWPTYQYEEIRNGLCYQTTPTK